MVPPSCSHGSRGRPCAQSRPRAPPQLCAVEPYPNLPYPTLLARLRGRDGRQVGRLQARDRGQAARREGGLRAEGADAGAALQRGRKAAIDGRARDRAQAPDLARAGLVARLRGGRARGGLCTRGSL